MNDLYCVSTRAGQNALCRLKFALPLGALLLAGGCVATTPTQTTAPAAAPAATTRTAPSATTSGNTTAPTTARAPGTGTAQQPQQQDLAASIAQGVTAALLGEPVSTTQTTTAAQAPSRTTTASRSRQPATAGTAPTRRRSPTSTGSRSTPSTATTATRAPVSAAGVQAGQARKVGTVMTDYGPVWVSDDCMMAEVDGVSGQIVDDGGELWIIDDDGDYLAPVPAVRQCELFLQAAELQPGTQPSWMTDDTGVDELQTAELQPGAQPSWMTDDVGVDTGGFWIDDNCEWAEVDGVAGYVAADGNQLFIFSEAGDYLGEVPPGLYPQCNY